MAIRFVPISTASVPATGAPNGATPMTASSGRTMEHAFGSAPTLVGHRVHTFLRRLYPRDTAKRVSQDTGISLKTVERMLERKTAPGAGGYIAMTLVYGPDFLNAVLPDPPGWLDRAVRAERQAALEAEQARITRELERLRQ